MTRLTLSNMALLVPLAVYVVSDIATRTIPLWMTLPAFALAVCGSTFGLWPYSLISVTIGFVAFALADLPRGDQKAMAVVCGFLAPGWACLAVACSILAGCWLLLLGRRSPWHTIEWPFFPWCAASVLLARAFSG